MNRSLYICFILKTVLFISICMTSVYVYAKPAPSFLHNTDKPYALSFDHECQHEAGANTSFNCQTAGFKLNINQNDFSSAIAPSLDGLLALNTQLVNREKTNTSTAIAAVPLPGTGMLFGSAVTGLIGLSRLRSTFRFLDPNRANIIFGIKFTPLNFNQAINLFQQWQISKTSHQVCFVNVHTITSGLQDKALRDIGQNSLNLIDGLPLLWYSKLVNKYSSANRLSGPDLMLKCLEEGCQRDWRHFFLGGTEAVLQDLVTNMQQRYPGIEIVGWHSPPYRELTALEDDQLVDLINAAKPDFLWVGLGAPKQEKWIAEHLSRIHVPVQLGVGAAFNFHSGHLKRAPLWMRNCGLEWLYRMFSESRLIKRYLFTNPIFLLLFFRDLLLIRLLKLKRSS